MKNRIHSHTPTLNVIDGRGLNVSQVTYWRTNITTAAQALITRHDLDTHAQTIEQRSPRQVGRSSKADFTQVRSLSGAVLLTDSLDAGWRLTFFGEAGQALEKWDSRGSHWRTEYDDQLRQTVIYEKAKGETRRVVERLTYAVSSDNHATTNRCGRLIRHDDPAGTRLFSEYDAMGSLLSETRHVLNDHQIPHWPQASTGRDLLLEPGAGHTTSWQYGATGEKLKQTDAAGHQQRFWYDVAGQLKKITLILQDATEPTVILDNVKYNALGQIASQTAGNYIHTTALYSPANGRMTELKTTRSKRQVTHNLQNLHYTYDAVGNVLQIEDRSIPAQHNDNQQVKPISTYVYDSLYQLVRAQGREAPGASIRRQLPDLQPSPVDLSRLLSFIQYYTYDKSGNLTTLKHVCKNNNYTHEMDIATDSNRGLLREGVLKPDFAKNFDANGNQQLLQTGHPLTWNARNQLQNVTLVKRTQGTNDTEHYLYDGSGMRVRKRNVTQGGSITHTREVRYLPGLEIHSHNEDECLQVITLQAGRCNVRCLHWVKGKPNAIDNNQLRYSFGDHLGSSTMELDDQGNLISQEGYYPYGGTAWLAARSELEASYKTIRYSGKERDASGLYYYGLRYYAPWLQRWINPDPSGPVDGLNLYCMVGNNPLRFVDTQGLGRNDLINKPVVLSYYDQFSLKTVSMTDAPSQFAGAKTAILTARQALSPPQNHPVTLKEIARIEAVNPTFKTYSKKKLNEYTAHAAVITEDGSFSSWEHFNFTEHLGNSPYPGVVMYRNPLPSTQPAASTSLGSSTAAHANFGIFEVTDPDDYLNAVKTDYVNASDVQLHGTMQNRIKDHLIHSGNLFPIGSGTPGRHAEVRAMNKFLNSPSSQSIPNGEIYVMTQKLKGVPNSQVAHDFITCQNCNALIPEDINIPTERLPSIDYPAHLASMQSLKRHYTRVNP
jgi:insecticidal toxin complex protein TccC